ncbi:MAG: response regulator [Oscillospiraceae bacterium]|jgi:putative two-component system response regulator|nr:response regulator [Oscillospiraceae bacterium]
MIEERKTVCIVDDNQTNLLMGQKAIEEQYRVFTFSAAAKLFKLLEKVTPDLILLDVDMPELDGYETLRALKKDPGSAAIPVIFLTAQDDEAAEIKGLTLGAVDYIKKPFSVPVMRKRVENHLRTAEYEKNMSKLVEQRTAQLEKLQEATLEVLAEMVEARDQNTGGHLDRTKKYFFVLLEEMKKERIYEHEISLWEDRTLARSVQLHDVGKIAVSDVVLNKPGRLTDEEFEQIKRHTTEGVRIIEQIGQKSGDSAFVEQAKLFAGTHHEKWNGNGYPSGLAGEEIPLQGRILAIADVYDALVSARPYKNPMPHEKAVEIIIGDSGIQFDPLLIMIFKSVEETFREISQNELQAMDFSQLTVNN